MRKPSFISHQHRQPGILARLAAMSFLSLAVILCTLSPAGAATINVNTTVDDININGNCTLREAVQAANTNVAVDACPAGAAGLDTINIPAGTYTVTLAGEENFNATGDFDIRETADFIGAGPATTIIDGGALDGVFGAVVTGVPVSFTGLTIRNGNQPANGGGITSSGPLTLTNCIVSNNTAGGQGGGIAAFRDLTIINSTISGNTAGTGGGGIYKFNATDVFTITNSTISGNTTNADGGGIFNRAIMNISNSTISGNTAFGNGGGIFNLFAGVATAVSITNSTISGNTASLGGGIMNDNVMTVTNSTITANSALGGGGALGLPQNVAPMVIATSGGGIHNTFGTTNLKNTIVANQVAGGDCSAPVTTTLNDLDSDGTCGVLTIANPLLGPLANNGGPTFTHALLPGSPAIDAGDAATCTAAPVNGLDQRGITRPQGPGCDIGAFELEVVAAPPPAPACTNLLTLNTPFFNTGSTLALGVQLVPWAGASTADAYVSVRTPAGATIFLQLNGRFAVVPTPMVSNWTVAPFNGQIFSHTFGGAEPAGLYVVNAFFTVPGTFNATGPQFCPKAFTFIP